MGVIEKLAVPNVSRRGAKGSKRPANSVDQQDRAEVACIVIVPGVATPVKAFCRIFFVADRQLETVGGVGSEFRVDSRGRALVAGIQGRDQRPTSFKNLRGDLALFSHSDQVLHWQTSLPDRRITNQSGIGRGWGGRVADLLHSLNDSNQVSMNISIAGHNTFQTGTQIVPYGISDDGALVPEGFGGASAIDMARTSAITNQLDLEYSNLFERTFVSNTKSALDLASYFQSVIDDNPISVGMNDSNLEKDLKMVARNIKAASTFGHKRQTFFVSFGGWDHHDNTLSQQAGMLPVVSKALKKFRDALVEIGMLDKVTLFQTSDFGRTLTTNGQGSDHAWGGNYLVMGGGVNGGEVYGAYPDFNNLGPIDAGRGRLIPSTSVDEYVSELVQWFGVPPSELSTVLPNIGNFPNGSQTRPIGFLA